MSDSDQSITKQASFKACDSEALDEAQKKRMNNYIDTLVRSTDLYKPDMPNSIMADLTQLITTLNSCSTLFYAICQETKIMKALIDILLLKNAPFEYYDSALHLLLIMMNEPDTHKFYLAQRNCFNVLLNFLPYNSTTFTQDQIVHLAVEASNLLNLLLAENRRMARQNYFNAPSLPERLYKFLQWSISLYPTQYTENTVLTYDIKSNSPTSSSSSSSSSTQHLYNTYDLCKTSLELIKESAAERVRYQDILCNKDYNILLLLLKQCLYPILSTHPLEDIQSSSFISSPYVIYLLDCLRSLIVFNNKVINHIISNDNNNNILLSLYCELLKLYVLFNYNSNENESLSVKPIYYSLLHYMSLLPYDNSTIERILLEYQEKYNVSFTNTLIKQYFPSVTDNIIYLQLELYFHIFESMSKDLYKIKIHHYEEDTVVQALTSIYNIMSNEYDAFYFFYISYSGTRLLIQCLNVLDETVILKACQLTYLYLYNYTDGIVPFIERGGLYALKECINDYDPQIRIESLKALSVFYNIENEIDIKKYGILKELCEIIDSYPSEDCPLEIFDTTVQILIIAVKTNVFNQDELSCNGRLDKLCHILKTELENIINHQPSSLPLSPEEVLDVITHILLCITNTIYHNTRNQNIIYSTGIIEYCWNIKNKISDTFCDNILTLLINCIDTNKTVQNAFGGEEIKNDILYILDEKNRKSKRALGYIMISHLCWNSEKIQQLYTCEEILKYFKIDINYCNYDPESPISIYNPTLSALYAFINLSLNNNKLKQSIKNYPSISRTLIDFLTVDSYDIRKNTIFCLSNLIDDNEDLADQLYNLSIIPKLIYNINDNNDDPLSTKAYQVLERMSKQTIIYIISSLYYMNKNEINNNFSSNLVNQIENEFKDKILKLNDDDKANKPHVETNKEFILSYVSILNGLLYTNSTSRKFFLSKFGIAPLLYLIMKTDNELRDIICLILTNSSLDRSTSLQNESVKEGLLTVFEELFVILSKKSESDKNMKEEHYIYPFDVLTNYTLNNSSVSYTIMNWKNDFYMKLLKYCHSSNKEYSVICVELLISILEQSKAGAIASGISGTKTCLNEIVKYDYLSDALRARAKQCIRDLKL